MVDYKGITFAEGYNKPFAEFKEEFGSNHIFNNIPAEDREQELEKAYQIAISNSTKEIPVIDPKNVSDNGNTSTTSSKSKTSKT